MALYTDADEQGQEEEEEEEGTEIFFVTSNSGLSWNYCDLLRDLHFF